MAIKSGPEWRKLPVTLAELCIDTTLRCGQSFRWRKFDDEWCAHLIFSPLAWSGEIVVNTFPCRRCTLHGRILCLKQDPTHLHYKVTWPESASPSALPTPPLSGNGTPRAHDDTEALLRSYFALNLDLGRLYEQWSNVDPNFRKKAPTFTGVRILNQDAWEALIAFICSSNNNISRISQMVCFSPSLLAGALGELSRS